MSYRFWLARLFLRTKINHLSCRRFKWLLELEALERRDLLSTFTVINANDPGAGSLRQAILDSNANTPGQIPSNSRSPPAVCRPSRRSRPCRMSPLL